MQVHSSRSFLPTCQGSPGQGCLVNNQRIVFNSQLYPSHMSSANYSQPGNNTGNNWLTKGSDWIRLVFAHPFPLNSGAPIAFANFISDGKFQVSPYWGLGVPPSANGGSQLCYSWPTGGHNPVLFQSDAFLYEMTRVLIMGAALLIWQIWLIDWLVAIKISHPPFIRNRKSLQHVTPNWAYNMFG